VEYDALFCVAIPPTGEPDWNAGRSLPMSDEVADELAVFLGQAAAALPAGRSTQALLNLAGYGRIAVAYLDREVIEATLDREFTAEEWGLFSQWLEDYDGWVSNYGDLNRQYIEAILDRANLEPEA
jgi:hypothetical protein